MTNTTLLKEKIKNSGVKVTFLAKQLGITYMAFTNRMNGKVEFRMNEVRKIVEILHLTPEETQTIFFA